MQKRRWRCRRDAPFWRQVGRLRGPGVRLEVTLPWLLARFAHAVQRVVGQKPALMLEKK